MSLMGSTDCAGDSRYSSISLSVSCACGWNTSARCFVNMLLFLCHFLPIFLELVSTRKGGDASVGFCVDLIDFQIELS